MSPHPRLTSSRREADHRREPPATLVRLSGTPLCFSQPLAGHRSFRLLSYALRSAPPHKFRFQDLEACSSDSGQQSVICEPTRTFFLFLFRPPTFRPLLIQCETAGTDPSDLLPWLRAGCPQPKSTPKNSGAYPESSRLLPKQDYFLPHARNSLHQGFDGGKGPIEGRGSTAWCEAVHPPEDGFGSRHL